MLWATWLTIQMLVPRIANGQWCALHDSDTERCTMSKHQHLFSISLATKLAQWCTPTVYNSHMSNSGNVHCHVCVRISRIRIDNETIWLHATRWRPIRCNTCVYTCRCGLCSAAPAVYQCMQVFTHSHSHSLQQYSFSRHKIAHRAPTTVYIIVLCIA